MSTKASSTSRQQVHGVGEQFAVRYQRDGRSFTVGKVIDTGRGRVFYFKVRSRDVLQTLDALSVAPEVVELLEAEGITEVHAFLQAEQQLYIVDLTTLREEAVLLSMNPQIGKRLHLPRRYWRRTWLYYNVPFIRQERVVVADDEEPRPVQMALPFADSSGQEGG